MSTAVTSLWPSLEEIGTTKYLTPVAVMRQQAEAISQMTSNILEGQIISEKIAPKRDGESEKLKHTFLLRASALGGLTTTLFSVAHDLARAYPATFQSVYNTQQTFGKNSIKSQNDFQEALREFFHSGSVKEVLQSLIAQSIGPEDTLTTAPF
jgi:hypothetical protein